MRHDKLERELRLLLLLIGNHRYTVPEICEKIGISRRNLYYYLEFFKDAGFKVEHRKPYYAISTDSAWFRKLDAAVHFTEDEAIVLHRILQRADDGSEQVGRLMRKLNSLYDLDIIDSTEIQEHQALIATTLYEAIKQQRVVILKDYSSPHSGTVSDRQVEPFLFMNGNREIRCYEYASQMNKTFKLSRIGDVEILDLVWSNEASHRQLHTDVFMFSSETLQEVTLLLGRLSSSLLREEFPRSADYIVAVDDNHWRCSLPVASWIGVGRFVLGLYDDIEVEGPEAFRQYLSSKVAHMQQSPGRVPSEMI